jgi:hypothetical protein
MTTYQQGEVYNLPTHKRGDSFPGIEFEMPFSLTGYEITMEVRKGYSSKYILKLILGSGLTVISDKVFCIDE